MSLVTTGRAFLPALGAALLASAALADSPTLGLFEGHGRRGQPREEGDGRLRPRGEAYTVTGGGANTWFDRDAFHFVWRKAEGDVELGPPPGTGGEPVLESTLETIAIDSKDRRVVRTAAEHFEAPNWSRDGRELVYNSGGLLYAIPAGGGQPRRVDTGFATKCNNDHGLSPDGTQLAISDQSQKDGQSLVYVLPAGGGTPRLVTPVGPSYWHGWSPDGKTLAYCAERGGEYDVYTIRVEGGEEKRLTRAPGLDDGPDYSPDGEWIYFNSERTGLMQVWRMRPDGRDQQQLTSDGHADWFPHPSPDGRWVAFLSYGKDVKGHPPNKDVTIRMMPAGGGDIQLLAKLFGGQGTINVPSWSPDSRHLAFVSYRLAR